MARAKPKSVSRMGGTSKILHIFPTFAPGGVQLRIIRLIERLEAGRYQHQILALDQNYRAAAHAPNLPDLDFYEQDQSPLKDVTLSGLSGLMQRRRALAKVGPDLLCTYNWGAMDWAMAARFGPLPHLHFESGFGPDEAIKPLRRRSLFRQFALARIKALVVPSQTLVEIANRHHWVAPKKIRHIPNAVDCQWYQPGEKPERVADDNLELLTIAPLRAEKRLDRLIDHFAPLVHINPRVRLTILGEGPCRPALEAQIAELGVGHRIALHGHVTDIRPALNRADLFLMTSITEQMPNALLQAMAAGLPVLAFAAGDIAAILPPKARFLVFAQNDDAGFGKALLDLAQNPSLRHDLGAENRRRVVAHYDLDIMVAAYDALYQQALALQALDVS
ncbi:glycosyl transferase family 1 [Iodidimonas nitroreducens]|uniref:Glycosyl transferase family 1 n=1 Tax=Iodidimonas nitroreducens TaxID=1236968 RepID=A0A5A7N907_9PROT|nr:glycosyltransferase family 4 protein [Iodidimonas nitroreducens]GAK32234.1 phosphatidylinositol N-acetylglucosaminyltransferase gpi3 subunit [alpha proteobacterium Q-1]GER04833.1 glycosyl transferase family 1 [Iodidimonas nitroreducens]